MIAPLPILLLACQGYNPLVNPFGVTEPDGHPSPQATSTWTLRIERPEYEPFDGTATFGGVFGRPDPGGVWFAQPVNSDCIEAWSMALSVESDGEEAPWGVGLAFGLEGAVVAPQEVGNGPVWTENGENHWITTQWVETLVAEPGRFELRIPTSEHCVQGGFCEPTPGPVRILAEQVDGPTVFTLPNDLKITHSGWFDPQDADRSYCKITFR